MNQETKIALGVIGGLVGVGAVGAIAVAASKKNAAAATPSTPSTTTTTTTTTTTAPTWTRATTLNPGDHVRLAILTTDVQAMSVALQAMPTTDPERAALVAAYTAAQASSTITNAGTDQDYARTILIILTVGTVGLAFSAQPDTLYGWFHGHSLPSDWPSDDPTPASEFQVQFTYGGAASILVSALPLPVIAWTSSAAGSSSGGSTLPTGGTTLPPAVTTVSPAAAAAAAYLGALAHAAWFPPPGTVQATSTTATTLDLVTDPMLICMAQDALGTISTYSNYTGTPYTAGVTGAKVDGDAFSQALASYQTIAQTALSGFGSALRQDGGLDYRTLGFLIFESVILGTLTGTAHTTPNASTSGIDAPLMAMGQTGLAYLVSRMSSVQRAAAGISASPTLATDLAAFQTSVDAQYHSALGGNPLPTTGALDWGTWGLLVGFGGG